MQKVFAKCRSLCLLIFLVSVAIRLLPEFFSGLYPVGYDLLAGYAPSLYVFPDDAPLRLFGWAWSPLAVYVLWFFWRLSGIDLFLFLKVAGPVFYGFFVSSFYYMLWKGLGWEEKESFVTALVFLLQPAVFRTGWDQLREELGFVFLFVLLAKTKLHLVGYVKTKPLTVIFLSVLVVLSHQLVAVLLFVVVAWQFIVRLLRDKSLLWRETVVFLPSIFVFIWGVYSQFVSPSFSDRLVPIQLPSGSGFFAFTNYFLSDPRFISGDWLRVLLYVGSLSLYCVSFLVPFAVKGFFKDNVFAPMLVWLCIGSYSIFVFPWFAFSHYWWWILLLPIPLTVYTGNALKRFGVFVNKKRFTKALIGFLLLGVVCAGYACSVIRLGYPYAFTYIPAGLVESCVAFEDIPVIKETIAWLNINAPINSTIIIPEKFQGFASMYARLDLRFYIAPALLPLSEVWRRSEIKGSFYALYYLNEVGLPESKIEILEIVKNIVVCQLQIQ